MNFSKSNRAFTLIELLVVISIIGLLSAVVLGFVNGARESGRISSVIQFDINIKHTIGDQLVLEWNFDESSGTTVSDTSGYGNNGTISGTSYSRVGGMKGKGLSFDSYSASVSAPAASTLRLYKNSFTASIWAKTNSGADMRIFQIGTNSDAFLSNFQGYLRSCFNDCDERKPFISDGKWHHFAVIGDKTSIRIYFDGKLMTDHIRTPSSFLMTGGVSLSTVMPFNGVLDEFKVYSAPLEVAQIEQLYAEGLSEHQDLALTK